MYSILISSMLVTFLIPSLSISEHGNKGNGNEIARDGRFIAYGNGTVKDTQMGFMWAARDNGADINWQDAKKYCENYRRGGYSDWPMPIQDELAGLYDENKKNRHGYAVTKLLDITDYRVWASETLDGVASHYCFRYGKPFWIRKSASSRLRVLPVGAGN